MASTPRSISVVAASMRRAHARRASMSRPESSSSSTANRGFEHRQLHGLVALLLAAGEIDVERAGRGSRVARPIRSASAATSACTVVPSRPDAAKASVRRSSTLTPGTSIGYCMARNSPAWARCQVGRRQQIDAVEGHRSGGDRRSRACPSARATASTCPNRWVPSRRGPRRSGPRGRSPWRISRPATSAFRPSMRSSLTPFVVTSVDLHEDVVALDPHGVHRHRPWWPAGRGARRRPARSSCRASSTRSRACRGRPRPRTARRPRGCSGRRWRTSRHRCAPRRCRCLPTSNRRASPSGDVVDRAERVRRIMTADLARSSRSSMARRDAAAAPRPPGGRSSTSSKKPATIEPLGDLGGHAAALEVEALILVDRTDGRRVAAAHVVVLDLEVGHRLGPRARPTA